MRNHDDRHRAWNQCPQLLSFNISMSRSVDTLCFRIDSRLEMRAARDVGASASASPSVGLTGALLAVLFLAPPSCPSAESWLPDAPGSQGSVGPPLVSTVASRPASSWVSGQSGPMHMGLRTKPQALARILLPRSHRHTGRDKHRFLS